MKRSVLENLVQVQKRFATRVKVRWAVFVIAIWLGSLAVIVPLIPAGSHRDNLAFFWAIGAIAVLVLTGVVASRRIRRHAHENGLFCGACQALLIENHGQKAVISGQCPKCGAPIVDDQSG